MWNNSINLLVVFFALFMIIANISATMLNKMGDNGSPYRNPFLVIKLSPMWSFILILTCPFCVKASIHLHHVCEKYFICKVCLTKDYFTLSYAFSKSILKMIPLCFLWLISCNVSCRITTLSIMFLPSRKVVWVGFITFWVTYISLSVATLVKKIETYI
jgi:hypothetical protein